MNQINIRNFAIVAHVDHGKSTLADRFLEITGTVQSGKHQEQFLDQNPISRERGITIKLAPVRMNYILNSELFILNLIDTPGHIDFSYEVSRTLAACEGVILLVDATQGIQAQTVAHFQSAKKEGKVFIPVVNKIDLPTAKSNEAANDLHEMFGFLKDEILFVSAKTGQNVKELLDAVIERIPPPRPPLSRLSSQAGSFAVAQSAPFRALIFDAVYDDHRGVIAFVRVFDGSIRRGDKIKFFQSHTVSQVGEVGYFSPFLSPKEKLSAGEIGYVVTGIKDIRQVKVGDTVTISNIKYQKSNIQPLPGYKTPKPMVFFGVYPKDPDEFGHLKEALNKLILNDASLTLSLEYSSFLGSGFRVGFLGLLHAEIVKERLKQEENIDPLLTKPQVLYRKDPSGLEDKMLEPFVAVTIYVPKNYIGPVMSLCEKRRGRLIDISYVRENAVLKYEMPYSVFIRGFSNELKSVSSGFASIDYEPSGYKEGDFVNLEILVNDSPIDVLSEVVYKDEVDSLGRKKTERLKELLKKQQFRQVIQARAFGRILARSEVAPFRKDVLSKMSGGDRGRKDKLLKKQKKGKLKLFRRSQIDIPQEALFSFIKQEP